MTRMQLAPLVKGKEAVILLRQAATLADSLGRPDLGAGAHAALGKRFAEMGNHAAAYAESLLADSLERSVYARESAHQLDELDRLAEERDSIARAGLDREQRMAMALVEVQRNADQWMKVALAAMVTGLVLLLVVLFRMGGRSRKMRASIAALQQEVERLKVPVNRRKEPPAQVEPPKPADMPSVVQLDLDSMSAKQFLKAAPERLATLAAARQQGDQAKVLRVAATLKPQLLAMDEPRFGPLLARIRREGAANDVRQWAADLDALESGIKDLLARLGAH
jgi:hypothetical protein